MKLRNLKKDYTGNWVQTVTSVLAFLFALLVAVGVITPEQSVEGLPILTSMITAVSTIIAGAIAVFGLLFKNE